MASLTKPDPAADPAYYLLADESGAPTVAYRCESTGGGGGSTGRCEVVVKAREAGVSRYVVTAGEVVLYRGDTPAGPWEEVCEQQYVLQWRDEGGSWRSVGAEQLADVSLSVAEAREHVDVVVRGVVTRPSGRFRLASRYGVDLAARKFLAEDRLECAGLSSGGAARPLRLVQRVVLARDHDALVDTDDDVDEGGWRRLCKRVGSLELGWQHHAKVTGDLPRVSVQKAERTVSVLYHEEGVDALDVDPHVVIDDSNTYRFPNIQATARSVVRNSSGHTLVVYLDATNTKIMAAYAELSSPPTQTSDWTHVTLVGSGGVVDTNAPWSTYWAGWYVAIRDDKLHLVYTDSARQTRYAQCDVSGGMSAVGTASNWTNADGTTQGSEVVSTQRPEPIAVAVSSQGYPALAYYGRYVAVWDGSSWTADVAVGTNYMACCDMCIDDDDVLWFLYRDLDSSPDVARVRSCAFAEAGTAANWSASTIVLQDDATSNRPVEKFLCIVADGAGDIHCCGSLDYYGGHHLLVNWQSAGAWQEGTGGAGSGYEPGARSDEARGKANMSGTGDGEVVCLYGPHTARLDQRNTATSPEYRSENPASYGGDPSDYAAAVGEEHQLATSDVVCILAGDGADIEFFTMETGSGRPWWGRARTGGGGSYLTNRSGRSSTRASSASCGEQRCGPCEQSARNPTVGANGQMTDAVGDGGLSSSVVSEYPGGKCPWDPDDKCHDPELTPY